MRQAKDYLIFPLDVASMQEAEKYIDLLSGHIGIFKIGLELFIRSGPAVIKKIQSSGDAGIFLDLKLHDIPMTVFRAMRVIADLGVRFTTVHCDENEEMLKAAVDGSQDRVGVLGVTLLTSTSARNIKDAGYKDRYVSDITRIVLKRAKMARRAGCTGVVCSGLEVKKIKAELGEAFAAVTPGIRPLTATSTEGDDQERVTTPSGAVRNGSDYLVIGRPIRDATDPIASVETITAEIDSVRGKI
jgi:orotidine-5'-phosphate decarboxylase